MLTERQAKILGFVAAFQEGHGAPPSTREVARAFTISQPTALEHLRALVRKGKLEKLADGRLGIKTAGARQIAIPVYGTIPAGNPLVAEQETDERMVIDPGLFALRPGERDALWALRVSGNSMEGAGIHDGDLAIMLRREPKVGEIIAALIDGTSTTLKQLIRKNGRLILRAANRRYSDIVPATLESQGVYIGLIRAHAPRQQIQS